MMHVRGLKLAGFMRHLDTELSLPETGVVAVTGDNGAGKSTIIEAVSWVGWGKTLRGSSPWRKDGKLVCSGTLQLGLHPSESVIQRTRKGAKTELDFTGYGEHDTATKAQEALDNELPSWDLWRRAAVFSSSDAAHFTSATDGERKKLIETFLGSNRFDPALEACRADLKKAEHALNEYRRRAEVATATLEANREGFNAAKRGLAELKEPEAAPPVATDAKPQKDYRKASTTAKREYNALVGSMRELERAGGEHDALARQIEQTLLKLRGEQCPTCTQKIPDGLRRSLGKAAEQASNEADAARAAAAQKRAEAEAGLEELKEEIEALDAKALAAEQAASIAQLQAQARATYERQRAQLERQRQDTETRMLAATDVLTEVSAKLEAAELDVAELTEVEKVLGLKGVRAHILGGALAGIEAVANAWLARLRHDRLSVQLRPYSEKARGGVSDSISLDVIGAGDGWGYKASSGGERRRLDIAILLALAEVSAAAQGEKVGTMFFDEVFDCLDEAGTEAVAAALAELAQERCVVVITHSQDLLAKLHGARRLHITEGAATWR